MLDPSLEIVKKVLKHDEGIIYSSDIFKEIVGRSVFDFLDKENIFKKIEKEEINERTVTIKYNGSQIGCKVFYEDPHYLLEPEEEQFPILKRKTQDLVVGEISRHSVLSRLCFKNEFSCASCKISFPKDYYFVGERVFHRKNIKWILTDAADLENGLIQKINKDLKKLGCDLLVISVVDDMRESYPFEGDDVIITPLRPNLILEPQIFLKLFSTIEILDILKLEKYPIFVDAESGYIYFYGKKINPGARSKLYDFLAAMFKMPKENIISNDVFCRSYYQSNGKSYELLKERYRELRKQLKRLYGKGSSKYKFYQQSLICSERGKVKCDLKSEDIFWLPREPSP